MLWLLYARALKQRRAAGRPVFAQSRVESSVFKLDADGAHASRVKVLYGTNSMDVVEIRAGLNPGDQVILFDMSKYANIDHLRLIGRARLP
jgi:HlyD family secretion protein